MVRMRPCAEGAQAPHWLPLCSCYCCHCSCAVSGQSHNASCVAFINVLSLSSTQSYCLWLITPALFLLVFLFVFLTLSLLLFSHLCFRFVPLLHVFFHCFPTLIFLTCQSLLRSTTICLHLPPNLPRSLFLSLANIFSISPDFELQATLFVSFPIYHCPSQAIGSRVYLCCHRITDVARR